MTTSTAARDVAAALVARLRGDDGSSPRPLGLTAFKRRVYRRYEHPAHLAALDEALEAVSRYIATGGAEGVGRLLVEMPPRHGKSLTVSRMLPAWHVGNRPDDRVMLVSYGADLAQKNSRWVRNLMRSRTWAGLYPSVRLADDSQAVNSWNVQGREGGMDALGIDGGATGKGAHLLSIDDPFKNRQQAESVTYRERVWDAYKDDLYTRLEPGGAVIVTQTRWHEDDLIGRLLMDADEDWTRLRLAALAEKDDPLGREEGAALWPARYPADVLDKTRRTLGGYSWSALYQQAPAPAEGGIFRRDRLVRVAAADGELRRVVRFWDLAMSSKTSADYTVGVKMGEMADGSIIVLDVVRVQMEWADVVPMMRRVILDDGAAVVQGIERQGYMSRAVQMLAGDAALRRHVIKGYPTDVDKLTRALPFAARVGEGLVKILWRGWSAEYVDELASFPNAGHDDQVDASAGAFAMLAERVNQLSVATRRTI